MRKSFMLTLALLAVSTATWAQTGQTQVAYDKMARLLVTLHFSEAKTLECITYTGNDQTTIKMGNNGMPAAASLRMASWASCPQ